MVIEFARIKRRSCASVATFETYRAICERQRPHGVHGVDRSR
jgi:hypothetical protein